MHKGSLTEHEHEGACMVTCFKFRWTPCSCRVPSLPKLMLSASTATVLTLLRNFNSLTLNISASVTLFNALTHTKYLLVTHSNFTGNHFLCTGVTLQLPDTPLTYLTQNLVLSGDKFLNVCWHISIIWQLSITYLTLPTNYLTPPSIYRSIIYFLCNRSAIESR